MEANHTTLITNIVGTVPNTICAQMTCGWIFFSFYPITVFPKLEGK